MRATYKNSISSEVIITFDNQSESLAAPNGEQYLPCTGNCGKLITAGPNVVAKLCDDCRKIIKSVEEHGPVEVETREQAEDQLNAKLVWVDKSGYLAGNLVAIVC